MTERKGITSSLAVRYLGSYILLASLLVSVIVGSSDLAQFAEAQIITQERCNTEICHVTITKEGFIPKSLIVKIGTTVVWTNTDDVRHTITSGSPGEITPPLNSKILNKGETYEFAFGYSGFYKGKYQYFDQITRIIRGEIIVEPEIESAGTTVNAQTINIDFNDPNSGVKKVSFSGGTIKSMEKDPDSHSLILNVETAEMFGTLEITLDRNLIDAKMNSKDDRFVAFVKKATSISENEAYYEEISNTPTERALRIFVPEKTTEIRIVGTKVVPEFPLALPVIALIFSAMVVALRILRKGDAPVAFHALSRIFDCISGVLNSYINQTTLFVTQLVSNF